MRREIVKFADDVFAILAKMDAEATTLVHGFHAGLCDYAGHCGVTTKRYEVPIYRALKQHLVALGYVAEADQPYEDGSHRECDVVIAVAGKQRLWLEVKQAWKEWFSNQTATLKTNGWYRSYLLGPGQGGVARTHSLAQDFEKLETNPALASDYAGVLLIALESVRDPVDAEIEEFTKFSKPAERGWELFRSTPLPDRNDKSCQVSIWLWIRGVNSVAVAAQKRESSLATGTACEYATVSARDNQAILLAEENPEELRARACTVFRRFLEHERKIKKAAGDWVNSWHWETAIAEILDLPARSPLVLRAAQTLRNLEQPYRLEYYDDVDRFERLLDRFERCID